MLQEFKDATRKVKKAIAVQYNDKQMPDDFKQAFPSAGRDVYSNGIIMFSKCPHRPLHS